MSRAEVEAAFCESGSTADSSTADGVALIGRAVAATGLAGTAAGVAGVLNMLRSADFCSSLGACLGVIMLGIRPEEALDVY